MKKWILNKKYYIILILFILITFLLIQDYNFENGSSLADTQDDLFIKYQEGNDINTNYLEHNVWVSFAKVLAPSNLVVRQYVLVDLFNNNINNEKNIIKQIDKIGSHNNDCIWTEGYSYWLYTKPFLLEYDSKYISDFIICVDEGFVSTAYVNNDILYPAPFGDLRFQPLEDKFQNKTAVYHITIGPVSKNGTIYSIDKFSLGFNTHSPVKSKIDIINGSPYENNNSFKWYEGYDKKYENKWEAIIDTLII